MRVYIREDVVEGIKRDLQDSVVLAQGNLYNRLAEGPLSLGLVECRLVVEAIRKGEGVMPWWGGRKSAVDIRREHDGGGGVDG